MIDLGRIVGLVEEVVPRGGAGIALIGGFAVSIRTEPRFTRDVDLAVAVEGDGEAESIVRELVARGFTLSGIVEHDAAERLATARLQGDDGSLLDLLFASSGIEPEVVAAAESLEALPGLTLRVATIAHLIAMKLLSVSDSRPTDLADLHALLGVAGEVDLATARDAVLLIEERGFSRNRNLTSMLDGFVRSR